MDTDNTVTQNQEEGDTLTQNPGFFGKLGESAWVSLTHGHKLAKQYINTDTNSGVIGAGALGILWAICLVLAIMMVFCLINAFVGSKCANFWPTRWTQNLWEGFYAEKQYLQEESDTHDVRHRVAGKGHTHHINDDIDRMMTIRQRKYGKHYEKKHKPLHLHKKHKHKNQNE